MIENTRRGAGGPWGPRWAERFERGMENGFNQGKVGGHNDYTCTCNYFKYFKCVGEVIGPYNAKHLL